MFQEGRQIIEGTDMPQVAGVDEAHEHETFVQLPTPDQG